MSNRYMPVTPPPDPPGRPLSDASPGAGSDAEPTCLVVSDLDGTLLDHDTYSCEAAEPALDLLESLSIPLVLASSKTAPEVRRLRRQLGNVHPFIVENGGAIWMPASDSYQRPEGTLERDGYWVRELASPRARWLGLLDELVLMEIYPAREAPISGVDASLIFGKVKVEEKVLVGRDQLMKVLQERDPELLVTMGAGNISDFVETIRN